MQKNIFLLSCQYIIEIFLNKYSIYFKILAVVLFIFELDCDKYFEIEGVFIKKNLTFVTIKI
jgi:hypothetical protein